CWTPCTAARAPWRRPSRCSPRSARPGLDHLREGQGRPDHLLRPRHPGREGLPRAGVTVRRGVTEATARRKAAEHLLIREVDRGTVPDRARDRTTLAQWVAVWGPEKEQSLPVKSTWTRYANLLPHHLLPELGRVQLIKLRPEHVLRWRAWMRTPHGP